MAWAAMQPLSTLGTLRSTLLPRGILLKILMISEALFTVKRCGLWVPPQILSRKCLDQMMDVVVAMRNQQVVESVL